MLSEVDPPGNAQLQDVRRINEEAISRSKRILALVDVYAEGPTAENRTRLRCALFDELRGAAVRDLRIPAPEVDL